MAQGTVLFSGLEGACAYSITAAIDLKGGASAEVFAASPIRPPPTIPAAVKCEPPLAVKVFRATHEEMWEREVQIMKSLGDEGCPFLVSLLDSFIDQRTGRPCIVMPR